MQKKLSHLFIGAVATILLSVAPPVLKDTRTVPTGEFVLVANNLCAVPLVGAVTAVRVAVTLPLGLDAFGVVATELANPANGA